MLEQLVVFGVRADPKLVDMIPLAQPNRPVPDSDTDGIDWLPLADPFELEAGVVRIRLPERVGSCRLLPNSRGEPV
jgi:hypothetical protein